VSSGNYGRAGDSQQENGLNSVLERNIRILMERRQQATRSATIQERIAIRVTAFAGSLAFVYLHAVLVGIWIAVNFVPGIPHFDPTLVFLATAASVEAIFLSTFVLISQNRMSEAADKRAELDVQIGLLTEHELTRVLTLSMAVARHLGVRTEIEPELEELKRDVAPEAVMEKLENTGL
jgi:uncharacterized membrane protein